MSCRWLQSDGSRLSGATVLEVDLPSGYGIVESDAYEVIRQTPVIHDVRPTPLTVSWFFEKVTAAM